MIIISGTGRSGTKLIHTLLTELGASLGTHEIDCGRDGGVGGYRVLKNMIKGIDYTIFNQVRHPLDVVKSSYSSKNIKDYPELNIIYSKYSSKEEYLMNSWLHMNLHLYEISTFSYTLEQLNNGLCTDRLIQSFNLRCSNEEFNSTLSKLKNDKLKNNTRKHISQYGSHITEQLLNKIDHITFSNCISLYNKINS